MIRLNDLEEKIMDALWQLNSAFPKDIMAAINEPDLPYNTVLSAIRKLEKDGHISYTIFGKFHEYYPITKKEEYGKSLFKKFYHDILDGSKMDMLSYFMKEEKVNIKELEKLLENLKKQQK
jgi:predicted transcriptional regulator